MNNSTLIKAELLALIKEMEQYHWLFTRNPETDFTRIKKWCKRQVLFHIFWQLIFHKKRQLIFHTYLVFDTHGVIRGLFVN